MKIEFRNIHVIERLSQKTPSFTPDLYVDGVLEVHVSNRGSGGGNEYEFPEGRDWLTLDCIEARAAAPAPDQNFEPALRDVPIAPGHDRTGR